MDVLEPYFVRGKILESAVNLEGSLDLIISKYFCRFTDLYHEFIPVVLHSKEFTFSLKKEVFLYILHKNFNETFLIKEYLNDFIVNKDQKIDNLLSKSISIRNEAAHNFSQNGENEKGEDIIVFFIGTHKSGQTDVKYKSHFTITEIEHYLKMNQALNKMIIYMEEELEKKTSSW